MSRAPRVSARGRTVRWPAWLVAGVMVGLVIGFSVGLTRPRVHPARAQA